MYLPSVKLASLAGPDDLCGVGYGGGPVEALSEGISYQRPECGMMATSPQVNVLQELDPFSSWDATHEDARGASLVHLPIKEDKGLGTPSHASCFGLVQGQSAVDQALEQRVAPIGRVVRYRWLWLDVHGLLFWSGGAFGVGTLFAWRFVRPPVVLVVDGWLVEIADENIWGTVARSDAILASASAASLYFLNTWLSSRPSNFSSRRRTALQYASILGSWQLDSFMT